MILKRFYEEGIAQASFLVGCAKTGEAVVVDANRDVDQYIDAAAADGLRIVAVTETHIHADYVSGSRELAQRTGARLYLSDEGDAEWKYAFAGQPNVTLVRDGDSIRVGNVRLDVVKTPGHTPEHIAFVLFDEPASPDPLGAFTGDFIFVGDVGRPDLLERAAGFEGTMEKGARVLFDSLKRFTSRMPDTLILWPAHGSGSACGKSLGGVPLSTLGYERTANWALKVASESDFVDAVLSGQPDPPVYFKEMKRINKEGPAILDGFRMPGRIGGSAIDGLLAQYATILDVRPAGEAATGFVPGTLNIPTDRAFTNWAGWLVAYDRPIYLVASGEDQVRSAVRGLQLIGLDDVRGWMGTDALRAYERTRGLLTTIDQIGPAELAKRGDDASLAVLDVRARSEYVEGHVPGAMNFPLGFLDREAGSVPRGKRLVLSCAGGARSAIGASVLAKHGFDSLSILAGGLIDYRQLGLPVETGGAKEALGV